MLSPDLVKYFDKIKGIIAKEGSVLSHLAIMARERRIPVVVVHDKEIVIGEKIKIDGATGVVEK